MPAWLCQRNSVLLQPGSSGASAPFSAQWLRLRQGWQTRLQFPRPVSLGVKGCSTQPHCTGTSLTAEGCRPCLLANQSVAPRKDVRKQKGFCGDVPHNIFLQPFSCWLGADGPGRPYCFSNLWSNLVSRNPIQPGGELHHLLSHRRFPDVEPLGKMSRLCL